MSYNPSNATASNTPYATNGKPDSARSYYFDKGNTYRFRPFVSIQEVLEYFPTEYERRGNFTAIVNFGGEISSEGYIVGGVNKEYWWKSGYLDEDLVIKNLEFEITATTTDEALLIDSTGKIYNSSKYLTWFNFIWKLFSGFTISELRLLTDTQLTLVSSFSCKDEGRIRDWYYDSSDSINSDNDGTILVTASGKRLKAKNFKYINPENFGGDGTNGSLDHTFIFTVMLATSYDIEIPHNKSYLTSKLSIPSNKNILLNGTLVQKNINTDETIEYSLLELNSHIKINGIGFIDGNSNILNASRLDNYARNYGISIVNDYCQISGITIKNTFNETIYSKGTKGHVVLDIREDNIGHGATFLFCEDIVYKAFKQINANFKYSNIYQHCLDFLYCKNVIANDLIFEDMTSTSTAPSESISGLSSFGNTECYFNDIIFKNNLSTVNNSLPIACDGTSKSFYTNIQISKMKCGVGLEVQGSRENTYQNIFVNSRDISNSTSGTEGVHILDTGIMGGMLNENTSTLQSRDRALASNNVFDNIKIIGGYTGFRIAGKNNTFTKCFAIGNTYGWRINQLQGGVVTNYWNTNIVQDIDENKLIDCGAKNCLQHGISYWGSDNLLIRNFTSVNNPSGLANFKRATYFASSSTSNTVVSSTSTSSGFWNGYYIFVTTGNATGDYRKIIAQTTDIYTVDSDFSASISSGDEFTIIDKQGKIIIEGGSFEDNQNFILTNSGSTNYTGAIVGLNKITVAFGNEKIDYNQLVKLVGVVGGASSNDLICRVTGFDEGSTDRLILTPYTLGDGSSLSGTLVNPLVSGSGTITTSDILIDGVTNTYLTQIDGITANLASDIDAHFWIKIGSEYAQIMKKVGSNSYLLTSRLSTVYTNSSFQISKFDIAGVPNSQYGLNMNRHYGDVIIRDDVRFNNMSNTNINNFRSNATGVKQLKIVSGNGQLSNFEHYVTNNTSATTLSGFSVAQVGKKIKIIAGDSNTTISYSGNLRGSVKNITLSVGDVITGFYNGTNWILSVQSLSGIPYDYIFGSYAATTEGLIIRGGASGTALQTWDRTTGVTQKYSVSLPLQLTFIDATNGNFGTLSTSGAGGVNTVIAGQDNRTTTSPRRGIFKAESVASGSGTDLNGIALEVIGGGGTSNGISGSVVFSTYDKTGSTGTVAQSKTSKMRISGSTGNVIIGANAESISDDLNNKLQLFGTIKTDGVFIPSDRLVQLAITTVGTVTNSSLSSTLRVTSSSKVIVFPITPSNNSLTAYWKGVAGTNSVTVTAYKADNTINTADTSIMQAFILN